MSVWGWGWGGGGGGLDACIQVKVLVTNMLADYGSVGQYWTERLTWSNLSDEIFDDPMFSVGGKKAISKLLNKACNTIEKDDLMHIDLFEPPCRNKIKV